MHDSRDRYLPQGLACGKTELSFSKANPQHYIALHRSIDTQHGGTSMNNNARTDQECATTLSSSTRIASFLVICTLIATAFASLPSATSAAADCSAWAAPPGPSVASAGAVCSAGAVVSAGAIASAGRPLRSGLDRIEVDALVEGPFDGIPFYPAAKLEPDLAAYVPDSFAMLAFSVDHRTPYYVARFYKRTLPKLGWKLVDSYGIGSSSRRTKSSASLTFVKGYGVLSVDLTVTRLRRLQYSLFTYSTTHGD